MSDFEDAEVASAGVSAACILNAQRVSRLQEKSSDEDFVAAASSGKLVVVKETAYALPDATMIEENTNVKTNSGISVLLKESKVLEEVDGGIFRGTVEERAALSLASGLVLHYDSEAGCLRLPDGRGKDVKQCSGFEDYKGHLGVHNNYCQIRSTAVIPASYISKCDKKYVELHNVYAQVQKAIGGGFALVVSHVLFCCNPSVHFGYHQDTKEHGKRVDLTVIVDRKSVV